MEMFELDLEKGGEVHLGGENRKKEDGDRINSDDMFTEWQVDLGGKTRHMEITGELVTMGEGAKDGGAELVQGQVIKIPL